MSDRSNESATQLWTQIFDRMAQDKYAAIVDPKYDVSGDEKRLRKGLAKAGWAPAEIDIRLKIHQQQILDEPVTSPGVAPHIEFVFKTLCDDVEAAMDRLRMDSHSRVARGIEPRLGPYAAKTNVIMTDESIVTVGSFMFRFCGLVARAFTRTLYLAPDLWESADYTEQKAQHLLHAFPELRAYWLRIFLSYALTGTHVLTQFRPATKSEIILFEQVARAMEIFAIAHEYGHHHLNHGRQIDGDAKREEFDADQFALRIAYEVENKPFFLYNPYLSSGSGGIILLRSLGILKSITDNIMGEKPIFSLTHPDIAERINRFDTVAVLKPDEFGALKGFRLASARIMSLIETDLQETMRALTREDREKLQVMMFDG